MKAGDGEIMKLHRQGLVAEPTTYTVDMRSDAGAFQIVIKEDGTITRDSRKAAASPSRN